MSKYLIEIVDGLAFYQRGKGKSIFVMPYPHASTYRPVAESRLADLLVKSGFSVISFDPPGSFKSFGEAKLSIEEMLDCALKCLNYFKIVDSIPLIGHSMGSFISLAFTLRHSELISKLILVGGTSGWQVIKKYGIHRSFSPLNKDFWLSRYYGARIILNLNNLAIHKKLDNLNSKHSFLNKQYYEELEIRSSDYRQAPPTRSKWLKMLRNFDLSSSLNELELPVLLITGRHDRITPIIMAKELNQKIKGSKLLIFENSGHSPFIEEPDKFGRTITDFIGDPNE